MLPNFFVHIFRQVSIQSSIERQTELNLGHIWLLRWSMHLHEPRRWSCSCQLWSGRTRCLGGIRTPRCDGGMEGHLLHLLNFPDEGIFDIGTITLIDRVADHVSIHSHIQQRTINKLMMWILMIGWMILSSASTIRFDIVMASQTEFAVTSVLIIATGPPVLQA